MKPQWSDWSKCSNTKSRSRPEISCSNTVSSETCPVDVQTEECYASGILFRPIHVSISNLPVLKLVHSRIIHDQFFNVCVLQRGDDVQRDGRDGHMLQAGRRPDLHGMWTRVQLRGLLLLLRSLPLSKPQL